MTTPYPDETPLELYRFFPTYTKRRDELAGLDNAGEAILQKITYMLEKESGAHVEMLRKLLVNLDVDNCDVSRLDYLAFILGVPIPSGWEDDVKRQYLRQIPALLKIKGTHLHFAKKAAFYDHKDVWLVELWKTKEREDRYYATTPGPGFPLQSARVDMYSCSGSCESVCESTCEDGFQLSGAYVPPGIAEQILQELGEVLPVHVLLRRQAQYVEPNEFFETPDDTLGCHSWCESVCTAGCEGSEQAWPGSYLEGWIVERGPIPYDGWAFSTICVVDCEASCQTCCECGQEGTCETVCEVTCQLVCASVCQSTCMQACQTACQAACQVDCAASCEWACMSICVTVCETLCEASIEGTSS